ncbi:Aspyridones efflux protein apdF [Colletotrichum sidae]|uniref:Aspyridones efflux protein apdF n=1 Tax=Colletotrichum sidae TaxID=1347389 RepID=A0A4R8T2I0_9PEZI|nr:Aspyridones efflux protein apdF [Colletotrichum sidae]
MGVNNSDEGSSPVEADEGQHQRRYGDTPDGGLLAWTQVAMGHLVIFNCWGYITSSVHHHPSLPRNFTTETSLTRAASASSRLQQYYVEQLRRSASDISWIGSTQMFLLNFVGFFSGRTVDSGHLRLSLTLGCALQVAGVFSTAFATRYWHLFLAQGVCSGLGHGFLFAPVVAILPTYFGRNRALAVSLATCGASTGGMVFPLIAHLAMPRLGFRWTVLVMGCVVSFNAFVIVCFTRTRVPTRKPRSLFDFRAFAEVPYTLFAVGSFFALWGIYFAYFYIGVFGLAVLDLSQTQSLLSIIVMNGVGLFGRVIPALLADRYFGILNTLISAVGVSGILILGWAGVSSTEGLFGWAVVYGIAANATQSLFPAAVGDLSTDPTRVGTRVGMILAVVSVSCFTGPPIGGRLIALHDGDYLYAQLFGGLAMLAGCLTYVVVAFKRPKKI